MTKHWDVYLDSFVNVALPDDVDPNTDEGRQRLLDAAIAEYVRRLTTQPQEMTMQWELYEETADAND
jgi:hypothetical protein